MSDLVSDPVSDLVPDPVSDLVSDPISDPMSDPVASDPVSDQCPTPHPTSLLANVNVRRGVSVADESALHAEHALTPARRHVTVTGGRECHCGRGLDVRLRLWQAKIKRI